MKKGKFVIFINWVLLFSLPIILMTSNIKTSKVETQHDIKNLSTNLFSKVDEEIKKEQKTEIEVEDDSSGNDDNKDKQEKLEEKNEKPNEPLQIEKEKNEDIKSDVIEDVVPTTPPKEEPPIIEEVGKEENDDIIATYSGNMSFYYANCTGCSGITSTGVDVSDGSIYYNDKQYGNVRIIAAGTEIKKWSIVRIKNSSLGGSILAIVLDRGGDIGQGKRFLVDMLTNTSESRGGVDRGITVEVLRSGK